ncbi:MAG TPA: pyruvate kinase, partial [Acidimicrobiia bacterium]|nr:pyruvate kinase [Acidimicrobiia bacterium]
MQRHTKIIATLGPAVASASGILALVAAGIDVARLNFS